MEISNEEQKLMQVWLDIAEQLLNAGAEISRVEDTLRKGDLGKRSSFSFCSNYHN